MSQHHYRQRRADDGVMLDITAGYDRPLHRMFLNIEAPDGTPGVDGNGFLYTNLDDPDAPEDDWTYYEARLAEHGASVPEQMRDAILEDWRVRRGNAVTDWTPPDA